MIEWIELFSSILSNRTEVHSFELGIQFALLTVLIVTYSSKDIGGMFLGVGLSAVFLIQPIDVIEAKPWYFLSGLLLILAGFEIYLANREKTLITNPIYFPQRIVQRFRK